MSDRSPDSCLVIAHRGGAHLAPENTLAAIRVALEVGADASEMDVRATKDGHLVLMHDEALERTTDGHGLLRRSTLAEVGRLDAGLSSGREFAGEPVPTLRDALSLLAGTGCRAVVEVKEVETAARVAAEIVSVGMTRESVIICFDAACLRELRPAAPGIRLGFLVKAKLKGSPSARADRLATMAGECGTELLDLEHRMLDQALVEELHARRLEVWTWTVNDPARFSTLAEWGVDGITTDRPGF